MKASGIGFKPLPKLSELDPGIAALGFKVLILPRVFEEKTAGGIFVAKTMDGNVQREEDAGSEGMLVSMGAQAGQDRWHEGQIQLGDTVLFARYAGKHSEFTGDDGNLYRIMNDEDVLGARISQDVAAARFAEFQKREQAKASKAYAKNAALMAAE